MPWCMLTVFFFPILLSVFLSLLRVHMECEVYCWRLLSLELDTGVLGEVGNLNQRLFLCLNLILFSSFFWGSSEVSRLWLLVFPSNSASCGAIAFVANR